MFLHLLFEKQKNMTEKPNQISERLSALRKFMETRHLDAFIVPSTDPHLSEYPPKDGNAENGLPVLPDRQELQ